MTAQVLESKSSENSEELKVLHSALDATQRKCADLEAIAEVLKVGFANAADETQGQAIKLMETQNTAIQEVSQSFKGTMGVALSEHKFPK